MAPPGVAAAAVSVSSPVLRRFSTGQQALSSRRRVKTRPSLFPRLYQRLAVTAETKDELKGIKLTPTRGGLGMGLQQLSGRPEFASVEKMEALISSRDGMSYQEKVAWLERYYSVRPLQVGGRLVRVLSIGIQVAITWILEQRLPENARKRRGEVLRDALSALGPVFVKVGQTLATRPDLVGDEAAQALAQLQEKNKPFPSEQAFSIIRDEFRWKGPIAGNHLEALNCPDEEPLFQELSEEPIAAASLGQVYKGRMRPRAGEIVGAPVAVKVMRPRVGRQIGLDVHVIRLTLKWLQNYWGTEAELPNISDEVGAGLFRELNYFQEAENIEEFRKAHEFQEFLKIPTTFKDWTTSRVLCMEWVEGKRKSSLTDREKLAMVKMGVDCCMAQLLQTGIIHADPHDGNMMLAEGNQLCLLDFGLVTKITMEQQEAMASAILHTLAEEWPLLVEDMKIMGLLPEVPAIWVDPVTRQPVSALEKGEWEEMPEEEFTAIFTAAMTKSGAQRSFSQITEQLCELGASYRVNLPTWLVLIIRSMLTLDGFAAAMDYNPIEAAYPHAIRRALSPETPRGWEALKSAVLTPSGDVKWKRLQNLLGDDDALKDAASENKARAEKAQDIGAPAVGELHMDAAAEAQRVVKELMLSNEGKPLRRLIYMANTKSILQRALAKDVIQAAFMQASNIRLVVSVAAHEIEAQVAGSLSSIASMLRRGAKRYCRERRKATRRSWRAAAVYGVLARRHAWQLLGCGPQGIATALGLSMAAVLIGSVASVLALVNSLARIPSLLAGLGRAGPSLRAGGSTRETVADSGGPKLQGGAELAPMLKFLRPPSSGKGSWEERTSAVAI